MKQEEFNALPSQRMKAMKERIEQLEARLAKADALAEALAAWENAAADHMQFQDALDDAFAAYRKGSDT